MATQSESTTHKTSMMKPQMQRDAGTRKMKLSASQLQLCESEEELDEVTTIHQSCSNVARLLSGDTDHTDMTGLSSDSHTSFNNSFAEFDEDFFDVSLIDTELQKEALAEFEQQKQSQDGRTNTQEELLLLVEDDGLNTPDDAFDEEEHEELQLNDSQDLIEVSPGFNLPLVGSRETWKAIRDGRITITKCCSCQEDLTCIDDADLVVCCDCWVVSPVDQSIAGGTPNGTSSTRRVGMGVKTDDMQEWITAQQRSN
jgi:hypothetical protein